MADQLVLAESKYNPAFLKKTPKKLGIFSVKRLEKYQVLIVFL
jgi:hypothetical protein